MRRSHAARTGARLCPLPRLRPLARRLGFGHSDLRRPVDRAQRTVGVAIVLVFLVIAAPLAIWAASHAHQAGLHAEAAQKVGRYPVVATIRQPSAGAVVDTGDQSPSTVWARWRAPDGTARTGEIPAWPSAGKDGTRRIWVNTNGDLVARPLSREQVVVDTALAACWVVMGVGTPLAFVYALTRRVCDRRRAASWDRAWERLDRRYAG
ncbi:Rv1733c family protein [Actinomadura miaoliensis]|uniref:Membrane protein n=1 Tax=Actinomadura miaoliensis TaxID=430685 RepID=A0ABP7VYF1_9ACTN